jgi:hypothetical protein
MSCCGRALPRSFSYVICDTHIRALFVINLTKKIIGNGSFTNTQHSLGKFLRQERATAKKFSVVTSDGCVVDTTDQGAHLLP